MIKSGGNLSRLNPSDWMWEMALCKIGNSEAASVPPGEVGDAIRPKGGVTVVSGGVRHTRLSNNPFLAILPCWAVEPIKRVFRPLGEDVISRRGFGGENLAPVSTGSIRHVGGFGGDAITGMDCQSHIAGRGNGALDEPKDILFSVKGIRAQKAQF